MTPSPAPKQSLGLRLNILTLRFARHWLRYALIFLGLYATLPFVAPTLMKLGLEGPARVLYMAYSPFCHQFAFRSFFLFGEQPAYPRAITGTSETPFESVIANDPIFYSHYAYWFRAYNSEVEPPANFPEQAEMVQFTPWYQFASRDFVGNDQVGYKVSLCERDVAIYLMMFLGGFLYSRPFVRRRLRPVPLLLYIFLGLGPIGIDGVSQLLGYPPFNLWEARETLPIFRVLTGAVFGFMTAWLVFPHFDISMRETREEIELKLANKGIVVK